MPYSVGYKMMQHVNKKMAQSEHWEPVLRQYATRIKSGFWSEDYVNSCFQLGRGNVDVYAAYCFAHFHSWASIGKVLMAAIELDSEPERDSDVDGNHQALQSLPRPFQAAFWGGHDDCDGYVKWSEPIEFGQFDCTGREIVVEIPPRSVPLEVGYTRPDRSICHLLGEKGLARWAYGSKRIYLFVRNPNWPNCDGSA
jgi:hypothetical protein